MRAVRWPAHAGRADLTTTHAQPIPLRRQYAVGAACRSSASPPVSTACPHPSGSRGGTRRCNTDARGADTWSARFTERPSSTTRNLPPLPRRTRTSCLSVSMSSMCSPTPSAARSPRGKEQQGQDDVARTRGRLASAPRLRPVRRCGRERLLRLVLGARLLNAGEWVAPGVLLRRQPRPPRLRIADLRGNAGLRQPLRAQVNR